MLFRYFITSYYKITILVLRPCCRRTGLGYCTRVSPRFGRKIVTVGHHYYNYYYDYFNSGAIGDNYLQANVHIMLTTITRCAYGIRYERGHHQARNAPRITIRRYPRRRFFAIIIIIHLYTFDTYGGQGLGFLFFFIKMLILCNFTYVRTCGQTYITSLQTARHICDFIVRLDFKTRVPMYVLWVHNINNNNIIKCTLHERYIVIVTHTNAHARGWLNGVCVYVSRSITCVRLAS